MTHSSASFRGREAAKRRKVFNERELPFQTEDALSDGGKYHYQEGSELLVGGTADTALPLPDLDDGAEADRHRKQTHQGRIRSFPHVEGQFATHVFFEVPIHTFAHCIPCPGRINGDGQDALRNWQSVIRKMSASVPEIVDMMEGDAPLHISLSRTVPITSMQISSLLSELRKAIQKIKKPQRLRIGPHASVLVNDEKTRTFVTLSVREMEGGQSSIQKCIDAVSKVFIRHGLPPYYDNPEIHVSVAWCLGEKHRDHLETILKAVSYTHLRAHET